MMITKRQLECAEAVCAALHMLKFDFLGETHEDGWITWWTRGEKPKNVRAAVLRSDIAKVVSVKVEWGVVTGPEFRKGEQVFQIDCAEQTYDHEIKVQTEHCVKRVLLIFRDVVQGTGVASRDSAFPKEPESDTIELEATGDEEM